MRQSRLARRRLDQRLNNPALRELVRPHRGWVRAVRDALGMSTTELGIRMGISQQSVVGIEQSEERQSIQLHTLARAAAAMECELVYVIVPKESLGTIVRKRARDQARRLLLDVGHHSMIEDQTVSDSDLEAQIEDLADELIDTRGLWRDLDTP